MKYSSNSHPNIVALAGGVGGAKFVDGLAQMLPAENLAVIVNTGDDFEHLGLWISPDLDTVCYTLAGLANPETGWGQAGETWAALNVIARLGGPDWFRLGDRDLGTHLERTRRMGLGQALSEITSDFCSSWGIGPRILPMSDDPSPTIVLTMDGEISFQEYFVHQNCQPQVMGFRFEGSGMPAPGVIEAINDADLVLICPSNPWVSIDPIRNINGLETALADRTVIAVSPIIGGQAVKGPAAKMFSELGIQPSAYTVAEHYRGLLDGIVIDHEDEEQASAIEDNGIPVLVTNTWMRTSEDRERLAGEVLAFDWAKQQIGE